MKTEKVHLKLKQKHPKDCFRINEIIVSGYVYKEYEVNEDVFEQLLKDKGVMAWVMCKEIEEFIEEENQDNSDDEDDLDSAETPVDLSNETPVDLSNETPAQDESEEEKEYALLISKENPSNKEKKRLDYLKEFLKK